MRPDDDSDSPVLVQRQDDVLVLTLNQPARRNCLGIEANRLLAGFLREAADNPATRVIVITGAGGSFSGGGDLSAGFDSEAGNRDRLAALHDAIVSVARAPQPVIAAVDGPAYGIGLSLAAVCDLVVASDDARFCAPFTAIGLIADGGLHHSLSERIGRSRAHRMILTGEVLAADEAARLGLVDVRAHGTALETALRVATDLAARAPGALAATKELRHRDGALDASLVVEAEAQTRLLRSADFAEGRRAFFEKRRPLFAAE